MPPGLLDESNPTPLYLQLQQSIEEAVRGGTLKADEALPGERDLATQLGISRVTVRKAIAGLVEKGILVQRWGSGTFIAPQTARRAAALAAFELHRRHVGPRAAILGRACSSRSIGPASPKELMALGLSPGEPVSRIDRLRLADGMPMAIEHAVRAEPLPARSRSLVEASLYAVLHDAGLHADARPAAPARGAADRGAGARFSTFRRKSPALYIERRSFTGAARRSSSPLPTTAATPMISSPS